jgi:ribosomal protein S18 acetylase RimI-like enzyme
VNRRTRNHLVDPAATGHHSRVSDIIVRPATPDDYAAIGRLSVAAYEADGQLGAGTDYAGTLSDVATRAASGEVLVATGPSGDVLGAVLFVLPGSRYAELSKPGEAEFRMLAVDPAAQGRGVGQALVEACIARARGLDSTAIVICVRDFSAPAQRLYARLGFVRQPELDWNPLEAVRLLALRLDLGARVS